MNYSKTTKQKNIGFIILVSLLALIVAGGAIAGMGFAFSWWGNNIPTSTYNLNVASVEEIIGIEFGKEDFSGYYTERDLYRINPEVAFDGTYPEDIEIETWAAIVLNADEYGVDFVAPELGYYDVSFKIDGKRYDAYNVEYISEAENYYQFSVGLDGIWFGIQTIDVKPEPFGIDAPSGASICISTAFRFETFELVKFEKVA